MGAVAKVGIVTTGGSEAEKALASVAESIDAASKQVGKIDKSLDAGRGNVARYAVNAEEQFERVRAAIASGVEVTDDQREALERLEGELETAKGRAREYNEQLGEMKAQTGEVRNVHDALAAKFPQLTDVIGKTVAVVGTATAAYQGTRRAVEELDKALGIDIDAWIRSVSGMQKAMDALYGIETASEDAAQATAFLAAEQHAAALAAEEAAATKAKAEEDANERIRASLDPVFAAQQRYQDQVDAINASTLDAATKQDLLSAAAEQLAEQTAKATGAVDELSKSLSEKAAPAATAAADALTAAAKAAAESAKAASDAAASTANDAAETIKKLTDKQSSGGFLSPEELSQLAAAQDQLASAQLQGAMAANDLADALGKAPPLLDLGNSAMAALGATSQSTAVTVYGLGDAADQVNESLVAQAAVAERSAGALAVAAVTANALDQGMGVLQSTMDVVASAADGAGAAFEDNLPPLKDVVGYYTDLGPAAEDAGSALDGVGKAAAGVATGLDGAAKGVDATTAKIKEGLDTIGAAAEPLNTAADALDRIADKLLQISNILGGGGGEGNGQ